ncbi:14773_t:CDS:2 [Acaulospora colombiana]|uniref:14773_t:CDS:1 n=1 Tax=Acaulospora colombiana TaxID=27376 RepID=A0ACA9KJZ7_9GLOM|nr:14773_t:CDS:2 [Acaulospora colombiana]
MSFHYKPTISANYGRKIRQPRPSSVNQSFFDVHIHSHNTALRSSPGLDLDDNHSARMHIKQPMKDLTTGEFSLGKRPNSSDEVTESCSRLNVNDEDNPPPTKRRNKGNKGSVSSGKTVDNSDVFDFPEEEDEIIREFQRKASFKNSHDEKRRLEMETFDMEVFDFPENEGNDFIGANSKPLLHKGKKNSVDFKKTAGKKSEKTNITDFPEQIETFDQELRQKPLTIHKSDNPKSEDKKKNFSSRRNVKTFSDNLDKSDFSEDADVSFRGSNDKTRIKKKDCSRSMESLSYISNSNDAINAQEKTLRKKSSRPMTPSGSPKTIMKINNSSSSHLTYQSEMNSVEVVKTRSSRINSSSMRFSRFLTRKTSKQIANDSSGDNRESMDSDDVFDLAKYVNGRKGESHEPVVGIVSNLTNSMLNANIPRPKTPKKVSRSNKQSRQDSVKTSTKKSGEVKYTHKTSQKESSKDAIPRTPDRSISEVGTPISFLSFHQKKHSDSVWDAVDAVASPIDLSSSPRRQNLVAKMSKPSTPSKIDRSQPLSRSLPWGDSKSKLDFGSSSSQDRKEDSYLSSYEEDLFTNTSSSSFDFPSSPSSSYNLTNGNSGVQKTYGQGRTILGQDLDSFLFDTYNSASGLQFDEDKDDVVSKKSELKSSHELREVGSLTRFTEEMDFILDGLQERQNLNDKHSSELLIKESGFMEIIAYCLNSSLDPFNDDSDSLKRSDRLLINEMKEIIHRSAIFGSKSQISLKSIALRTLSSLTSLRTRYENFIKNELRTSGSLHSVLHVLKTEFESVPSILSSIENGKLPPVQTTNDISPNMSSENELNKLKAIEAVKFDVLSHVIVLLINLAEMDPNNQDEFCKRLPNRSVSSLINLIQLFARVNEFVVEETSINEQFLMDALPLTADQGQTNHTSQSHGRTIGESFLEIIEILKSLEA